MKMQKMRTRSLFRGDDKIDLDVEFLPPVEGNNGSLNHIFGAVEIVATMAALVPFVRRDHGAAA